MEVSFKSFPSSTSARKGKRKKKKFFKTLMAICSVGRQLVSVAFYSISLSSIIGKQEFLMEERERRKRSKAYQETASSLLKAIRERVKRTKHKSPSPWRLACMWPYRAVIISAGPWHLIEPLTCLFLDFTPDFGLFY